jgi:hypothetical protein
MKNVMRVRVHWLARVNAKKMIAVARKKKPRFALNAISKNALSAKPLKRASAKKMRAVSKKLKPSAARKKQLRVASPVKARRLHPHLRLAVRCRHHRLRLLLQPPLRRQVKCVAF